MCLPVINLKIYITKLIYQSMQKRYIPFAAVLLAAAAANAQTPVFHEGFDAEQTKANTEVAWYEYINSITNADGDADERSIDGDAAEGAGALKFANVSPSASDSNVDSYDQFWQRAVKFRNLPLKEGKSYRLTWRFKGSNTWNNGTEDKKSRMFVSLMQGGENADIPLLDANGKEFKYEVSHFNESEYETYTRMFHFASAQLQKDTYAKNNPDKEPLADTFFATFNVINPGEYFLDEVDLVESPIAGAGYEFNTIRVNFGFGTNIKDLVNASELGRVIMPIDCAKVTVGGNEVDVEAVELHKDGYMYIYTVEDIEEGADVKIAFTNPSDESCQVKYKGDLAPEGAVPNFENEAVSDLDGVSSQVSFDYLEPSMTSVTPVEGSFGLSEELSEVSFTFDRLVKPVGTCTLNDDEQLVLKTNEASKTLTFVRKNGQPFEKGLNEVSLEDVVSAKDTESIKTFTTAFEVGAIKLAETVYTQVGACLFSEAQDNTIPEGWTVYSDGEERKGGESYGSGGRVFSTTASQGKGIYTRANGGDGTIQSPVLTLPKGDVDIRSYLAYWSNTSEIQVDVCNAAGEVVATHNFTPGVAGEANRNADGFKFEECSVKFANEKEGDYYVKYTLLTEGFNGMFVGGFDAFTYKISSGESTEAQVVYQDKSFGSASDNCAPPEGSGWSLYFKGEKRDAGADYNYKGSRIFNLTIGNLTSAYYNGVGAAWPNSYVEYGNNDGEEGLHLEDGRYQITYYAANWKEKGDNKGQDHKVYFQLSNKVTGEVISEREDKIVDCDMNGQRDASIDATRIQFVVKITEEDDYTFKLGCTTEQMVGNIKIEKLGSQTAYYIGLVNAAREAAEAELANALGDVYNGTSKKNLIAVIEKYKDATVLHSPAEVEAAVAEMAEAVKAMSTRRGYAGRFQTAVDNAGTLITEVENTKYAKLDAYSELTKVWEANIGAEVQDLENDALIAAVTTLENNTNYLNNMKADDKGVALLTKQVVDLAKLLVDNDPAQFEGETVVAAGEALSDDQTLANTLKLQITKALYDRIASGENPFEFTDEDEEEEDGVTYKKMDLSAYIQNAGLYTTEKSANRNLTSSENVPGWTIENINGGMFVEWGWVAYTCSDYNPVVNQFLGNGWHGEQDISQEVAMLPVGKYIYAVGTQDRGFMDKSDAKTAALETKQHWTVSGNIDGSDGNEGEIFSYIWWQTPGMADKGIKPFDISNQGQWYGLTEDKSDEFDVTAGDDKMGKVTIGAHPVSFESSASVDNFRLYMIGKAEGFDYKAAAAKLADDIATSIEAAEAGAPEGEPIDVSYYNAAGVKVATPAGITIKVATYANGYVKVTKFMAK